MSNLSTLLWLGLATLLATGSALFSAFETALFSFQGHELDRLRRKKARYSAALSRVLAAPRRLLAVLVLGYVGLNVPLVLICLFLTRSGGLPHLPFWGGELLLLGLVVILCDLLPKAAALAHPYRFIRPAVTVLEPLLSLLQTPLAWMQNICDALAERLIPTKNLKHQLLDQNEMETLIELGAEDGALHPVESAVIQEILHLSGKTVRDCMTPRVDSFCIPDDLSRADATKCLRNSRFRRVPVYGETPDDILGILDVRAFLESERVPYAEMLTPPSFVPETMKAIDLLRSFLNRPQTLAIVVDEHGGTEGIITRADLVEEILSEALPGGQRDLYLEALGEGLIVASGSARIEDVAQAIGASLHVEGIDTIGGLVFNLSGALPKLGSVWKYGPLQLTVRRTSRKRVEELLVQENPTCPSEDPR